MRVGNRADQSGRAVRVDGIEIGSELGQRARGIGSPFTGRVHQRRPVAARQDREDPLQAEPVSREGQRFRSRVHVGAALDQQPDDFGVVSGSRPHQRRLAEQAFCRADVGAVIEEQLDRCRVSGARGGHQNGLELDPADGAFLQRRFRRQRFRFGLFRLDAQV